MGGDHKCPVCQATFTRPQHVARHMRSHTGDRPYKCQYCGDQFARSDLLSRHVNKCHSNEKPLPASGSRRKGSASASRATTSKQACDQCVQSSLPCDGCNPCAKCVQRRCGCTFVKFHRQTAPTGPGHNPQLSLSNPAAAAPTASSSRLGLYPGAHRPANDDFLLGPAPPHGHLPTSMAENLYSDSFSFAPLYPSQSPTLAMGEGPDFPSRYRAQAELLRRAGDLQPHQHQHQHQHHQFQDPRASPASWVGWDQRSFSEGSMNDKEFQHFIADTGYPSFPVDRRRASVDFSSSDGSSSIPSSAASSSAHLPMEGIPIHQPYPSSALADGSFTPAMRGQPHQQQHRHPQQQQQQPTDPASASHRSSSSSSTATATTTNPPTTNEGGFSSAFGLMSLDDPAVLAGLSSDAAPFFSHTAMAMDSGDPNATPMPMPPPHHRQFMTTPSKDPDARELREFWKQYMRTPGPSGMYQNQNHNHNQGQNPGSSSMGVGPGTPGYRRPRVASLPSVKTPVAVPERFLYQHQFPGAGYAQGGQPPSSSSPMKKHPSSNALYATYGGTDDDKDNNNNHERHATDPALQPHHNHHQQQQQQQHSRTLHAPDDLRRYEAAVLARSQAAPVTLNLKPPRAKARRGTVGAGSGSASVGSGSSGSSPRIPVTGEAGEGAGVGVGMKGVEGSASPDMHTRSRESSVAVSDGSAGAGAGADGGAAAAEGNGQGRGRGRGRGEGERRRPSFKRLPSQTLGPESTKRVLLVLQDDDARGGGGGGEKVGVAV